MAALVAAHRGAHITLVEEQRVGGTWLNARCIPTKSVTTAADAPALCRGAGDFCLSVPQVDADFPMLNAYRPRSIHQLVPGVEFLLGWRGITAVAGEGRLVRLGLVSVFAAGKISEIPVCRIFLVPGSIAAEPPIEGGGLPGVTTSAEALRVDRGPVLLVVIRGGGIALEFGCVYEILGSPFTVLEMTSTSLPCATDAAIAGRVQSILQHRGMALQTGASVHEIVQGEEVLKVIASESVSEAQNILIATGRWPTPSSLNPTGLGLRMSGRAINIDNFMATNPSEVWAACGTVPGPMLAHKAMMEGRVVGEDITGGLRHADHRSVPKVIFTRTEVPVWTGRSASVNQRRRNQGFANPDVYQSSRAHPGRRRWSRSVELRHGPRPVPASPSARPHVTDWIAEGALAVTRGATVDDLTGTSHAYPVSPEPMLGAALGFQGAATHMQSR